MRRGLRGARPRRAGHDRQGRRGADRREHARALRARHALLPLAAADARGLPQRQGAGRPDARRARHRLRRRRRLVRRLRRGDRDPPDGRGDAPGPRPRVDGHRRRHRLQHGLRQHLPVQPVPRAVDELAVRERARRSRMGIRARWDQAGHPERRLWVIGGDGAMFDIGFGALSRMVASGDGHQGPGPRHAGLLEHRRPGVHGLVRRPGHQAVGVRQGAPRPDRAAQGARADPDGPRRGVRRPDDAGPPQPLPAHDHGGQRLPGPGRGHRLHAVPAGARHRRRRVGPPVEAGGRVADLPAVHLRPAARPDASPSACRSRATRRSRTTGPRRPTGRRSTSWPSPGPRAGSPRTSRPTARRRPRSSPPARIGWPPGGRSRSWPACADPDDGRGSSRATFDRSGDVRTVRPGPTLRPRPPSLPRRPRGRPAGSRDAWRRPSRAGPSAASRHRRSGAARRAPRAPPR